MVHSPLIYQQTALHNVAAIAPAPDEKGQRLCRVPFELQAQLNENAQTHSMRGACCEIRFNLLGETATVVLQTEDEPGLAEVWLGSFLVSTHIVHPTPTAISITPPERQSYAHQASLKRSLNFDPLLYRLVLPYRQIVRLHEIIGEVSPPQYGQEPTTRYLAYGSSITNGATSTRPTGMYAMLTAQQLGADLINLGFGGGAHCEFELAEYIASRDDWNFATLELGINMVNWATVEEFASRAAAFVNAIANAHPDKWIFCLDMFPFWRDLDLEDDKPAQFREVVREIVRRSEQPRLVHIEATALLTDWNGLTADILHPAPAGMQEIARNLAPRIQQHLDMA